MAGTHIRGLLGSLGSSLLLACSGASTSKDASSVKSRLPDAQTPTACSVGEDCDAGSEPGSGKTSRGGLCTASGDCEEAIAVTSVQHIDGPIDYPDPPPAGGNHNVCWATWGVHAQALGAEHWVHNLEHGAVVFLYHCPSGCASEVSKLETFVRGHDMTISTEYDAMPKRFAVVAWGYRLQTDTLDLTAFETFYAAHVDHGPESIPSEPPASCPQ